MQNYYKQPEIMVGIEQMITAQIFITFTTTHIIITITLHYAAPH
ncbi:MAG: hypothetical protein ABL929_02930 [Ferruginibacter sp.]